MNRMEEDKKKREEEGFATKAMRDLERMKKAKVSCLVVKVFCRFDNFFIFVATCCGLEDSFSILPLFSRRICPLFGCWFNCCDSMI